MAGGVGPFRQAFDQEAYPPVARPPPPESRSRDLEDLEERELWSAITQGAKDLVILADEWKRRNSDDRAVKVLQYLGLPPEQTRVDITAPVGQASSPA